MMRKFLVLFVPILVVGCSVGDAPTGGSEEETKKVFDAQPLESKVKFFMNSPMPMADKKRKIEELYQKAGKPMPADIFSGPAAPGAPPVDTGPTR